MFAHELSMCANTPSNDALHRAGKLVQQEQYRSKPEKAARFHVLAISHEFQTVAQRCQRRKGAHNKLLVQNDSPTKVFSSCAIRVLAISGS